MTPAADGLPFVNTADCDSIEQSGDSISVTFTVSSGDGVYAHGEAEIKMADDRLILVYYSLDK